MSFDTFESYERELAELAVNASDAGVPEEIQKALENQYKRLDDEPLIIYASGILNAYNEACRLIRQDPARELVNAEVSLPDEPSAAGKFLVSLLNESLTRDSTVTPSFNLGSARARAACEDAEDNFLMSLGLSRPGKFLTKNGRTNRLFAGKDGTPIFFQKGYEIGSSLSLKPVSLNGIGYPAGTIFSLTPKRNLDGHYLDKGLDVHALSDISALAPMRLSAYSLPKDEQESAFTCDDDRKKYGVDWAGRISVFDIDMDELTQYLPPTEDLAVSLK